MSKQADRQLRDLLKKGGELGAAHAKDFRELASSAELVWCEADCSKARNRSALFRAVVKAVDYPQFFGGSFEGLYDCLIDTIEDQKAGLVLVFKDLHSADPDIERDQAQLLQVLNDVVDSASDNGRVFVYCIEHGGKHPDDLPGVVHNWSEE
ncbi:MAG: barstar family protein [Burkholderiaceae bacterium]|nr:barstar family protein [Burkholderiaceae bacterium]MCD8516608.1 barstar family protein [Burkholderiaceae bacterium]MCD8538042.1 barstar family protein [Burkholderiaceae bacterium]MCD8565169.1 barstar family protein [Burkholderiaceae bacterium]